MDILQELPLNSVGLTLFSWKSIENLSQSSMDFDKLHCVMLLISAFAMWIIPDTKNIDSHLLFNYLIKKKGGEKKKSWWQ